MLVGVGLGPGDPELLTVKAINLIRDADAVFVPGKVARTIIADYRTDVTELSFPMTDDEDYIRQCMEENVGKIAPAAESGLAVFCILGDPNFYGTFGRLCDMLHVHHPKIECTTVPGISSITAFASRAGVQVKGGFAISDGSDERARIFLKVRRPREMMTSLQTEGFTRFVLAERIYMEGEKIYRDDDLPEESSYFSVLYAERGDEE